MDIDEHVQNGIAGTCGNLYLPLIGKLTRYPIPDFPSSAGNEERLLDVGCGWGRWTFAASRAGYDATGVDADASAIAAARRIGVQLGIASTFVVGSGDRLPFPNESFDVVFSYSVLQHLQEDRVVDAFEEASRVLRPGGLLMVELPNSWGVWNAVRRSRPAGSPMRYYSPSEMRHLGERVGPSVLQPDAFFSLNAQASDIDLFGMWGRLVVRTSSALVRVAQLIRPLALIADSIFVVARKPTPDDASVIDVKIRELKRGLRELFF